MQQKNTKILIIDEMHPAILHALVDFDVRYRPDVSEKEVIPLLHDIHGLVLRSKLKINEKLLSYCPQLRFIARAGAGLDLIDLSQLEKRNIKLIHAPEGNRDAVGEHTIAMLLCLLNKIQIADIQVRGGFWKREENRGYELKNKVVALLGYGNMGKSVAKKLSGFECEVIAYDRNPLIKSDIYARITTLEEIFERADVISCHFPLDQNNYQFINAAFIKRCKKSIILLNTARGEVVDLESVIEAMQNQHIRGVCFDVLPNENINNLNATEKRHFNFLINSSRVLLTPHVAGWTFESYQRISEVLGRKIIAFWAENEG